MGRSRAKGGNIPIKEVKESIGGNVADGLLSPELMAKLGGDDGRSGAGGALAVVAKPSKGKKRGRAEGGRGEKISCETRQLAASMSKSKAKKLKQLEDKKLKDGRRADLYRKLEENRLSQQHLSLLQSSKTISQNQDTLRSRVKQAVQRAIAGIALGDATVAELEAHPDVVADVEEALSLPVGGALAASRKTTAAARGGPSPAVAGNKAPVLNAKGKNGLAGEGRAAAAGSHKPAPQKGVAAARQAGSVAALAGKKRGRSAAPAAPKPVQVVPITETKGGSESSSSSDSSSENESDTETEPDRKGGSAGAADSAEVKDGEVSNAAVKRVEPTAAAVNVSTQADADVRAPCGNSVSAGAGRGVVAVSGGDSTAEMSGSSWAAKMMSSLARVPTSTKSTEKRSAEATNTEGKSSALDDGEIAEDGTGGADDSEDGEALVAASYPPPPSWLEGNAPAYHAVETPLPSVSGVGAAAGISSSRSKLPRPERWVAVERSADLQAARMQLPVCGMEQEIMEAIHDNDTVILCGETGSGKSTQVPQFLYEAGYASHGLIGVTQPRRVAAVGTAERVAVELGTKCGRGGPVAYQIRYDASGVGEKTRVKFMTDGILLQEITSDLLLRKYSAVLLDEAHERNLNTDVLLGMLSRSIPLR